MIAHYTDSEKYRAEVSKVGAGYKRAMYDLITEFAAVEEFRAEFEKKVVDAEVSYRGSDAEICRGRVQGIIVGIIIFFIQSMFR